LQLKITKNVWLISIIFLLFSNSNVIYAWSNLSDEDLLFGCRTAVSVYDQITTKTHSIDELSDYFSCLSYIAGVNDAHDSIAIIKAGIPKEFEVVKKEYLYCLPSGVSRIQQAQIIIKYLEDNPAFLHVKPAALLVLRALSLAYPCK
jgi:hypothetical protein